MTEQNRNTVLFQVKKEVNDAHFCNIDTQFLSVYCCKIFF